LLSLQEENSTLAASNQQAEAAAAELQQALEEAQKQVAWLMLHWAHCCKQMPQPTVGSLTCACA
jgi:hypothetical protein